MGICNCRSLTYSPELRARWPSFLPREWHRAYPNVFDDADLKLALGQQPSHHFREWFVAVHLRSEHGACSLVEKYRPRRRPSKVHSRKCARLREWFNPAQVRTLREVCDGVGVQPPDLLARDADGLFFFVEVKRSNESLSKKQRRSHALIRKRLGVPVRTIRVRQSRTGAG